MRGHLDARHNLGVLEWRAGSMDRALKHFMIAAGCGYTRSLESIKHMFIDRQATKDDYSKALRIYQANLVEIKSPQRDEAAAFDDEFNITSFGFVVSTHHLNSQPVGYLLFCGRRWIKWVDTMIDVLNDIKDYFRMFMQQK